MKPKTSVLPLDECDEVLDEWYKEVCYCGGIVEYYPIEGSYVLLDTPMQIWDQIKSFLDAEMKNMNVKKCHFPLTSEVDSWADVLKKSMYPYLRKWIRFPSHLPLKLNQWCNAPRHKLINPTPFLRCREFMWQEGHGAFATKKEAYVDLLKVLEMYRRLYEELLAVPVLLGRKSENEKQVGGLYSTSAQVFIPETGHGVEGASAHCLGQTYAKTFNILFEDKNGEKAMVWQTSWDLNTTAIGLMLMIHGDDKGLVLPPRVAPVQVVVIPEICQGVDAKRIYDACEDIALILERSSFCVEVEKRRNIPLSTRHTLWERKGVPLRIQIGPAQLDNNTAVLVRRDDGCKKSVSRDSLADDVHAILEDIQGSLFKKAKTKRDSCVEEVEDWAQFLKALKKRRLVLAPWCDEEGVEMDIKRRSDGLAKHFGTPFSQPPMSLGTLCFASGKLAKSWSYWTWTSC
ncbi:unnamed protein product [Arabidopsis arenosa]|uniref:proline--tRNA ligase n=1 Tax=Arabidopsis arenosa TaxID=38785 RepID=A0A8S2ANI1_ARAAE|nr:unnamed protein product [Arabidopsis arenosa]